VFYLQASGESSPMLLGSPNPDQTNSLRSTRTFANLLAACVHDRRITRRLLELTRAPSGPAPQDTADALAALASDPGSKSSSVGFPKYLGGQPFGIAIAPDSSAWVSNSGGLAVTYPSSVACFSFEGGRHRRPLGRVGRWR